MRPHYSKVYQLLDLQTLKRLSRKYPRLRKYYVEVRDS